VKLREVYAGEIL